MNLRFIAQIWRFNILFIIENVGRPHSRRNHSVTLLDTSSLPLQHCHLHQGNPMLAERPVKLTRIIFDTILNLPNKYLIPYQIHLTNLLHHSNFIKQTLQQHSTYRCYSPQFTDSNKRPSWIIASFPQLSTVTLFHNPSNPTHPFPSVTEKKNSKYESVLITTE